MKIYRFETSDSPVAEAESNAIFDGKDSKDDSPVRLYAWTPPAEDFEGARDRLQSVAESLPEETEVFTTGGNLYLAAPREEAALEALEKLRGEALFTGEWPGLIEEKAAEETAEIEQTPKIAAPRKPGNEMFRLIAALVLAGIVAVFVIAIQNANQRSYSSPTVPEESPAKIDAPPTPAVDPKRPDKPAPPPHKESEPPRVRTEEPAAPTLRVPPATEHGPDPDAEKSKREIDEEVKEHEQELERKERRLISLTVSALAKLQQDYQRSAYLHNQFLMAAQQASMAGDYRAQAFLAQAQQHAANCNRLAAQAKELVEGVQQSVRPQTARKVIQEMLETIQSMQ